MSSRSSRRRRIFHRGHRRRPAVDDFYAVVAACAREAAGMDLNRLTPLEALNLLAQLKKEI